MAGVGKGVGLKFATSSQARRGWAAVCFDVRVVSASVAKISNRGTHIHTPGELLITLKPRAVSLGEAAERVAATSFNTLTSMVYFQTRGGFNFYLLVIFLLHSLGA